MATSSRHVSKRCACYRILIPGFLATITADTSISWSSKYLNSCPLLSVCATSFCMCVVFVLFVCTVHLYFACVCLQIGGSYICHLHFVIRMCFFLSSLCACSHFILYSQQLYILISNSCFFLSIRAVSLYRLIMFWAALHFVDRINVFFPINLCSHSLFSILSSCPVHGTWDYLWGCRSMYLRPRANIEIATIKVKKMKVCTYFGSRVNIATTEATNDYTVMVFVSLIYIWQNN